jgi:hypothetical protein
MRWCAVYMVVVVVVVVIRLFFFLSIKNKNGPHFLPANHNKTHTTPPRAAIVSLNQYLIIMRLLSVHHISTPEVCVCVFYKYRRVVVSRGREWKTKNCRVKKNYKIVFFFFFFRDLSFFPVRDCEAVFIWYTDYIIFWTQQTKRHVHTRNDDRLTLMYTHGREVVGKSSEK